MGITTPQKLWISLSTVHYCFMVITRVFSVIFLYTASLFCVVLLQPRCSGGHYRENNPLSFLQVAVADNNYTALQPTQHINNKIPFSSFFFLLSSLSLSLFEAEAVGKGRERLLSRIWININQVGLDTHSASLWTLFPRVGFPILPETLKE